MVNINDMASEFVDLKNTDILELIFERQKQLMKKYGTEPVGKKLNSVESQWLIRRFTKYTLEEIGEAFEEIEKKYETTGKFNTIINFENRYNFFNNNKLFEVLSQDERDHLYEEIADSLHFYVEKIILTNVDDPDILYQDIEAFLTKKSGKDYTNKIQKYQDLEQIIIDICFNNEYKKEDMTLGMVYQAISKFTIDINIADNFLRSKEWQKDQKEVYVEGHNMALGISLFSFVVMLLTIGITHEEIIDLYLRKHKVNQFRIGSNY